MTGACEYCPHMPMTPQSARARDRMRETVKTDNGPLPEYSTLPKTTPSRNSRDPSSPMARKSKIKYSHSTASSTTTPHKTKSTKARPGAYWTASSTATMPPSSHTVPPAVAKPTPSPARPKCLASSFSPCRNCLRRSAREATKSTPR